MGNKYKWEVVVETEVRTVVHSFGTKGSIYDGEAEMVMRGMLEEYQEKYPEDDVYIREAGKSIYRIAVEHNGSIEYAPVADYIALDLVFDHILKVREVYECYNVPMRIWLEKTIYGVWVTYF